VEQRDLLKMSPNKKMDVKRNEIISSEESNATGNIDIIQVVDGHT